MLLMNSLIWGSFLVLQVPISDVLHFYPWSLFRNLLAVGMINTESKLLGSASMQILVSFCCRLVGMTHYSHLPSPLSFATCKIGNIKYMCNVLEHLKWKIPTLQVNQCCQKQKMFQTIFLTHFPKTIQCTFEKYSYSVILATRKKTQVFQGKMWDHHSLLALWSLTVTFLFLRHICFESVAKIPAD